MKRFLLGFVCLLFLVVGGCGKDDDVQPSPDDGCSDDLIYHPDSDGDGYGDPYSSFACPSVYDVMDSSDCNDSDPAINPDEWDVCDGIDNNCDGERDENGGWSYDDADGDGFYGGEGYFVYYCVTEEDEDRYTFTDCDDTDPGIHYEAIEIACDGIDNDCDGIDLEEFETYYLDSDGDGYGSGDGYQMCPAIESYVSRDGDCDDTDAGVYPNAEELCDGIDQDCDGHADEGYKWEDGDGDGYGGSNSLNYWDSCTDAEGVVVGAFNNSDCQDANPAVYPDADEICDSADNDCDGSVDEKSPYSSVDQDADGWGAIESEVLWTCEIPPEGYLPWGDCDDTDADVNPGAEEIPGNGVDDDCDESTP